MVKIQTVVVHDGPAGPTGATGPTGPAGASGSAITPTGNQVVAATGAGSTLALPKGALPVGNGTNVAALPVGTDTQVLTADSTQTDGVKWAAASTGMTNPMTTQGDLIVGGASGTPTRLAVGVKRQKPVYTGTPVTVAARYDRYVDIRDYSGADPTGVSDSAAAINQALTDSQMTGGSSCWPVMLNADTAKAAFTILSPLVIPQSGHLEGCGQFGNGSQITFSGTTLTAHAITPASSGMSGMTIKRLRLVDGRTDPTRTGYGINIDNVRNYTHIEDCNVQKFYDNYHIENAVDCLTMLRNWGVSAVRYNLNINGGTNSQEIAGFWGDTKTPDTTVAHIRIGNMNNTTPVLLRAVKHECNQGAHTLQLDSRVNLTADGLSMLWSPTGVGGDVVHISSEYAEYLTLMNVGSDGTAANLLRIVADSFVIPGTEPRINFWTGYGASNQSNPAAAWIGRAKLAYYQGNTPEATIVSNPGSIIMTGFKGAYVKASGTGNTGYRRIYTYSDLSPTIAAGTGAGTTPPTVTVSGNGRAGTITISTGTTPAASATVATVTFGAALDSIKAVTLTPVNALTSALSGAGRVYADSASWTTSLFVIKSGSTALAASSASSYQWAYTVME